MKTYKIASIPGDGIGVEVVDAGLRALHALADRAGTFQFDVTHILIGVPTATSGKAP